MIAGMPAFAVLGYVTPYENTAAVMAAGRRARWLLRAAQGGPNHPIPLRMYAAQGAPIPESATQPAEAARICSRDGVMLAGWLGCCLRAW